MRFGIFMYDDVEPIDVGATYGVLSMARRVVPAIEVVSVAGKAGEVALTNGLRAMAEYGFGDCPPLDVLIVLGGAGWQREGESEETLDFLREQPPRTLIVSVCTGALILAAAGLLDGRRATTRRRAPAGETTPLQLLGSSHGDVRTEEAAFVDAGRIITGGGVTLAIDTTLYVIERLYGADDAAEIARLIDYATAREANALAFASAGEV